MAPADGKPRPTKAEVVAPSTVFPPPKLATRYSTLLFRGLLLTAAGVALAFIITGLLAAPEPPDADPTSPDAPPPAVFVQPDR